MPESRELGTRQTVPTFNPKEWSAIYRALRPQILDTLDQIGFLHSYFVVFGEIGNTDNVALILVPVKDSMRKQLIRAALQHFASEGLLIRVASGKVGLYETFANQPFNPYYEEKVKPGASIGPAGCAWSGTMGIYLRSKNPSDQDIYALSCAHTFAIYDAGDASKTYEQLQELLPANTPVTQPSNQDHTKVMCDLQADIKIFDEMLEDRTRLEIMKAESDGALFEPSPRLRAAKERLDGFKAQLASLQSANTKFGTTTAFYELDANDNGAVDYMLIRINQTQRIGGNWTKQLSGIDVDFKQPSRPLNELMNEGAIVHSRGRTTNGTGKIIAWIGDAKVERFPNRFPTIYALGSDGSVISTNGDSGTTVREHATNEASAYVFGGGATDEVKFDCSWLLCLVDVIRRIYEKFGLDLELDPVF